ncbi:hypothetical protein [Peptoniphilus asaccharolyticus]
MKARELSLLSILSIIILLSGTFKIPSPFIGSEFQLSAPIAILIVYIFGFKKYLISGVVSSIMAFALGFATLPNIVVAMVFRICVGVGTLIFKNRRIGFLIIGPASSFVARIVLSKILGVNLLALLIPSIFGMCFTVIVCFLFYKPLYKIVEESSYREFIYYKMRRKDVI